MTQQLEAMKGVLNTTQEHNDFLTNKQKEQETMIEELQTQLEHQKKETIRLEELCSQTIDQIAQTEAQLHEQVQVSDELFSRLDTVSQQLKQATEITTKLKRENDALLTRVNDLETERRKLLVQNGTSLKYFR